VTGVFTAYSTMSASEQQRVLEEAWLWPHCQQYNKDIFGVLGHSMPSFVEHAADAESIVCS
jgi:hypothetical protein